MPPRFRFARSLSLSVSPTSDLQSGGTLTVRWNDENTGTSPVSISFSDMVQIVNTTTGQTLSSTRALYDETALGSVPAGGSAPQQTTFQVPDGSVGVGNLQVMVTNDVTDQVNRLNPDGTREANSTATVTTTSTLANYPNLQATGLTFDPSSVLQSSGQVTLDWNDSNTGSGAANGGWSDHISVVNTTTGQAVFIAAPFYSANNVAAGGTTSRSINFTLPNGLLGVGQLQVTVTADSNNSLLEYNPDGTPRTVVPAPLSGTSTLAAYPDLQATGLAFGPSSVLQSGGQVTLNWSDSNPGSGAANGGWSDHISVVNTTTGQPVFTAAPFYSANNVAAGGSISRSINFPLPNGLLGVGQLQVSVTADSNNSLLEYNPDGTPRTVAPATLSGTSVLAANPDLQATSLTFEPSSVLQSGGQVTLDWNDSNAGGGAANGGWSDHISVVNTTTGQPVFNGAPFYSANNVAAGGNTFRSINFTLPNGLAGVGQLQIMVTADYVNNLVEYNLDGTPRTVVLATLSGTSTLAAYP